MLQNAFSVVKRFNSFILGGFLDEHRLDKIALILMALGAAIPTFSHARPVSTKSPEQFQIAAIECLQRRLKVDAPLQVGEFLTADRLRAIPYYVRSSRFPDFEKYVFLDDGKTFCDGDLTTVVEITIIK